MAGLIIQRSAIRYLIRHRIRKKFSSSFYTLIIQSLDFGEVEASVAPAEASTTVLRSFTLVTTCSVSTIAHTPDVIRDIPKRTLLPSFHISVINVSPG